MPVVKRSNNFVKDHVLLSCLFIDIISSSNDTTVWMAGISLLEMVAIEEQLAVLMVSFLDNLFASAAGNTIIADDPFSFLHKKFVEWILSSGTGRDKLSAVEVSFDDNKRPDGFLHTLVNKLRCTLSSPFSVFMLLMVLLLLLLLRLWLNYDRKNCSSIFRQLRCNNFKFYFFVKKPKH